MYIYIYILVDLLILKYSLFSLFGPTIKKITRTHVYIYIYCESNEELSKDTAFPTELIIMWKETNLIVL